MTELGSPWDLDGPGGPSFTNALRLAVKARVRFSAEGLPDFAPKIPELVAALGGEPLDAETSALLKSSGPAESA